MNIEKYVEMWKKRYNENENAGENLEDARKKKLQFYKNECIKHGYMLFYTNYQYCPACAKDARDKRRKNNRIFNRGREIYNEIKRRAITKNIPFNLSIDDVRNIYGNVNKCPILGIDINYSEGVINDNSPSFDRLAPDDGYTVNNVNIISNRANRIKNNGSAHEHLHIALWMFMEMNYEENVITDIINDMIAKLARKI